MSLVQQPKRLSVMRKVAFLMKKFAVSESVCGKAHQQTNIILIREAFHFPLPWLVGPTAVSRIVLNNVQNFALTVLFHFSLQKAARRPIFASDSQLVNGIVKPCLFPHSVNRQQYLRFTIRCSLLSTANCSICH